MLDEVLWTRWQANISVQFKWRHIHSSVKWNILGVKNTMDAHTGNQVNSRNYQILSVLEMSHFSFPQSTLIRAIRDTYFDVNSHLYSLEHIHRSSNPLCFWNTDSFLFPSGRTKNLDGCQRPITMDAADQTCAVHWIPHTGHHTGSPCSHFFSLKSQYYFIISESYITAWWKWEHRSGPQNIPTILIAKEI